MRPRIVALGPQAPRVLRLAPRPAVPLRLPDLLRTWDLGVEAVPEGFAVSGPGDEVVKALDALNLPLEGLHPHPDDDAVFVATVPTTGELREAGSADVAALRRALGGADG